MRKILTVLVSLGMLTSAGIANASTIVLSPSTAPVSKGQVFTVLVSVDPAGATIYTVKGIVTYPSNVLEATAFTFAAGTPMWVPLSQPGYDSMTAGNVTKTAGFPGGFTTAKALGTITFRAVESGTATISVSPQSLAYDAQSKNTISGAQGASQVTVATPVATPPPAVRPQTTVQATPRPTKTDAAPATVAETVTIIDEATTTDESTESQAAAAGILGNNSILALIALLVVALSGGAWWYFLRRKPTL